MEAQPLTRDGTPWVPLYIESVDEEKCIGCGRCQKVCAHGVLDMQGLTEEGETCPVGDEEMERIVTIVVQKGKCIGCNACSMVCGSKAINHIPASAL
ncbi:MAG: ferredoxin III, nif-specific [Rhodospirillales bacterium]|nr:ferredoxin III, nif-specific [Rhodospirillales bacterium]